MAEPRRPEPAPASPPEGGDRRADEPAGEGDDAAASLRQDAKQRAKAVVKAGLGRKK